MQAHLVTSHEHLQKNIGWRKIPTTHFERIKIVEQCESKQCVIWARPVRVYDRGEHHTKVGSTVLGCAAGRREFT